MNKHKHLHWFAIALVCLAGEPSLSQERPATLPNADAPQSRPLAAARENFSQQELDQMLAPIALYPDPLLDQVLMASTYPMELVLAERWAKANSSLTGQTLADELEKQPWDPSVKSLTNSPEVLKMMSDRLEWTVQLGDAFIGQQAQVLDTIQKLRAKAEAEGHLKDTPQQRVVVEREVEREEGPATRVIEIVPADPEVIYVPVYDPGVVYGRWWYPDYQPYYYCPPSYPRYYSGIWFGISFRCGPPWGYAWGHCDWKHRQFHVDVRRHHHHNHSIDFAYHQSKIDHRNDALNVDRNVWTHDASHRRGVWYRDGKSAERFAGVSVDQVNRERRNFRTRSDPFDDRPASVNRVEQTDNRSERHEVTDRPITPNYRKDANREVAGPHAAPTVSRSFEGRNVDRPIAPVVSNKSSESKSEPAGPHAAPTPPRDVKVSEVPKISNESKERPGRDLDSNVRVIRQVPPAAKEAPKQAPSIQRDTTPTPAPAPTRVFRHRGDTPSRSSSSDAVRSSPPTVVRSAPARESAPAPRVSASPGPSRSIVPSPAPSRSFPTRESSASSSSTSSGGSFVGPRASSSSSGSRGSASSSGSGRR